MNEREQLEVNAIIDRLRPSGIELLRQGWNAELIVFAPEEIPRIPGYKVALVVPVKT